MYMYIGRFYGLLHRLGIITPEAYFVRRVVKENGINYAACQKVWENAEVKVHGDISDSAITAMAARVNERIELCENDVVLDVGVGDGRIDEKLKKYVKHYHGFDFSAQKLQEAKRRNPECNYWQQSFLEQIPSIDDITKVFSFGVMQYCKPDDVSLFLKHQVDLCPLGGDMIIYHLDVPDKDRAYSYYESFPRAVVDKYKKQLRVIFQDGSYWHDMEEVRAICGTLNCEVEIFPAKCKYRSDIVIRVSR